MKNQRASLDKILLFALLIVGAISAGQVSAQSRAEAQLETAAKALNNHNARQAIRLTTEIINAEPKNASAFFIRGKAWAEYDDSKNALLDLSTGMTLAPALADPTVYLTMAQAYLQLKQPERALHALQAGNLQKPNLELYKLSAGINNSLGHDKEALLDIEKALKFDPISRTMLLLRGSFYDDKHDYDDAIKDYSRVIEISIKGKLKDTNWIKAIKNRGVDYEKTGKKELARSDQETLKKEGSDWEKDLFDVAK